MPQLGYFQAVPIHSVYLILDVRAIDIVMGSDHQALLPGSSVMLEPDSSFGRAVVAEEHCSGASHPSTLYMLCVLLPVSD